jgi:hypothetical protein
MNDEHVPVIPDETDAGSNTIVLWTSSPEGEVQVLLTIKPDGSIVRGPNFVTAEQASLEFWKLVESTFPAFRDAMLAAARKVEDEAAG